jgi:hypothetical protein
MTSTTSGPPRLIFIIRHGEKPPDPPAPGVGDQATASDGPVGVDVDGNPNPHSLVPRGWQRSGALAVLFAPAAGPLRPGLAVPDQLLTPSYGDVTKTAAHRTYQTILGLSGWSGVPIDSPYAEDEDKALARAIVEGSSGTVLVCWEHHHIPDITRAIPTTAGTVIPRKWPGDRFDVIWSFTLVDGDFNPPRYHFGQIPQQLLAGDSNKIIAP